MNITEDDAAALDGIRQLCVESGNANWVKVFDRITAAQSRSGEDELEAARKFLSPEGRKKLDRLLELIDKAQEKSASRFESESPISQGIQSASNQ